MQLEGRIVRVIDRNLKQVVGELCAKDNAYYLKSDENKLNVQIIIEKIKR